jgi:hypothetical protein
MKEVTFLCGKEIESRVRDILKGTGKRCAVAFWSEGWLDSCGLDFSSAKIIVDVSMGMTSSGAISLLLSKGAELKHRFQFHGKCIFPT